MKKVIGHMTDSAWAEKQVDMLSTLVKGAVARVGEKPNLLNQLLLNAISQAGAISIATASAPDSLSALSLGAQTAAAIFAAAAIEVGEIEVKLGDGPPIRFQATGPTGTAHVVNWRLGFFVAAICRDRDSLDILSQTPIEVLRRSGSSGAECLYHFVAVLQNLWRRDRDMGELIQRALEATDPNRVEEESVDFVLNQIVPEIELVYRYMLQNPADFNESLVFALERHKKYWSKADRKRDPIGWFALGPLAIASFAQDADMRVEVESTYLPLALVRGDFVQ